MSNTSERRIRRKFTDEFKADAVVLVVESSGQIGKVAKELGICDSPLSADRVEMVEVGYGLVPAARGAGLATEALLALLAPVDSLGVRVRAHVDAENLASIRVLQKCGFTDVAPTSDDMLRTCEFLR